MSEPGHRKIPRPSWCLYTEDQSRPATLGVKFGMYAAAIPAFWTTRGFAVLEVNYRGTLGYGRGFREALYGSWVALRFLTSESTWNNSSAAERSMAPV